MTPISSLGNGFSAWVLLAVLAVAAGAQAQSRPAELSDIDAFNYVIGTQTIDPKYHFTNETSLVETAAGILEMGSNTLKISLSSRAIREYLGAEPKFSSFAQMLEKEPSYRRVLDMPFAYYLFWVYPIDGNWREKDRRSYEYRQVYELACYLLRAYNGSGKTFFLGNWEGDLMLLHDMARKLDPPADRIDDMVEWVNLRQKAVDDARRDTPHHHVRIYYYAEVNHVRRAMEGRPTFTNSVLPRVNVDYVSYSSYDCQEGDLAAALSYIESKLAPKKGIEGKRVFLGEYGFPAIRCTPQQQDERSRRVLKKAIAWGCPFVLYWEFYNNEIEPSTGAHRGFWMIDDHNRKQPIYYTYQGFYREARKYVSAFKAARGRLPTHEEFARQALLILDALPTAATQPAAK